MIDSRAAEAEIHEQVVQNRNLAASDLAQRCAIPDAPQDIVSKCLVEQVERYRQSSTIDEDLKAQQEVARWAAITGLIAVISLPISAGGLVAVWLSLRQTRTAILNDRQIGEAQVRAYVAVEPKGTSSITSDIPVSGEFEFRNTGQSPARNVRYVAGMLVAPYPLPDNQGDLFMAAPDQATPRLTLAPGPPNTGEAFAVRALAPEEIRDAMGGGTTRLYMAGLIWYEDVFGTVRRTRFCFYLDRSGAPVPGGDEPGGLKYYNWHQAHVHNDET